MSRRRMDTVSLAEVTALGEDDRKAVMEMVRDGEMDMSEVSTHTLTTIRQPTQIELEQCSPVSHPGGWRLRWCTVDVLPPQPVSTDSHAVCRLTHHRVISGDCQSEGVDFKEGESRSERMASARSALVCVNCSQLRAFRIVPTAADATLLQSASLHCA